MTTNKTTLWGIHAGEHGEADDLFLAKGYIAIAWGLGNLGEVPNDQEAFKQRVAVVYPDASAQSHSSVAGMIRQFVYDIAIGDAVVFRPKKSARDLVFLGRVAGPYLYNPVLDPDYADVRRVEWLRSVSVGRLSDGAKDALGHRKTLVKVTAHADEFFALLSGLL